MLSKCRVPRKPPEQTGEGNQKRDDTPEIANRPENSDYETEERMCGRKCLQRVRVLNNPAADDDKDPELECDKNERAPDKPQRDALATHNRILDGLRQYF